MTHAEFVELVRRMRKLQRRFFSGERTAQLVGEAKDAERRVDRAVAEFDAAQQPALFDRDEEDR